MRLLVIEDEPDLLSALARALRRAGYAVDVAPDGRLGLCKAQDSDYDAIVLDVMLPELDGWQVLAKLRETKRTPVLMLTARDRTADRVRGLDTGADDYLVKPFDLTELQARLRALIRRSHSQPQQRIAIGPVEIDPASRSVQLRGQPVALTPREFAILEYLARNRGKVVSRSSIYEHLFDENDDSLSNLIDVHIFNLRRKLGHEFILTKRGHGYCIAE